MISDASALLSQPSENYMDVHQRQFFKDLLLAKQRELFERIGEHERSLSVTERVADSSDAGTIEENRTLMMRIVTGERAEALATKEALDRIADDEYGWCADTGEEIGLRRLLNNPTALRTTEAQNRLETIGKHHRVAAV